MRKSQGMLIKFSAMRIYRYGEELIPTMLAYKQIAGHFPRETDSMRGICGVRLANSVRPSGSSRDAGEALFG